MWLFKLLIAGLTAVRAFHFYCAEDMEEEPLEFLSITVNPS